LACRRDDPTHLVEPRAKRASFLQSSILSLDLTDRVTVHATRIERVELPPVATITARAVASLDALVAMAEHLSDPETRWVLPKGRSAAQELEAARATWQGEFRLIPSTTDPEASIVLAEGIRRRRHR
ncbi:MAG TPA: RsmG family class I SAM-dependent methyltransferase, partial [Sphingomonas sp.]|nr:RsmG family class I SAM-dependent methyltransferase [Sphingomonas sp.]